MQKFVSIKQKFITSVMAMISVIFFVVLAVIVGLNIQTSKRNLADTEQRIKGALAARGNVLVSNNSKAMRGMAVDYAITSMQELVAATVAGDEEIVRGIYINEESVAFAYATAKHATGESPTGNEPLTDSVTQWVRTLEKPGVYTKEFIAKDLEPSGASIIEFAAPVIADGEVLGHIRYAITTRNMVEALESAKASAALTMWIMIGILIFLLVGALVSGYVIIEKLATRITQPIASLVRSAKIIANGDYSVEVASESNDEIGNLAVDFDDMRKTIKKYTEHLQDIIDEKMQQVKDILNNIDQGLFTVNFDGTVNEEYSARANDILKVGDVSAHNIYDLLHLDAKASGAFDAWVNLVKKKHGKQRWNKLEKLAPVHEMELGGTEEDPLEYVTVSYQKIYDKENNLSKLMILTQDETEKREKERQMKEERIRHENEMKTILGIANTPEEELTDFMEDSDKRLETLKNEVAKHLHAVRRQREEHPSEEVAHVLTNDDVDILYRDIHTIKGNGGSYGFDLLSEYAHRAEDALEELRSPVNSRRTDTLEVIDAQLGNMNDVFGEIKKKMKLIYGDEEAVFVRVPEERVEYIQKLTSKVEAIFGKEEVVQELAKEASILSWKPLNMVARKYQKTVQKASRKLDKDVLFHFKDEHKLLPPDIFKDMDEVMIHIVRNAIDHGIETDEVRAEKDKGQGEVTLEVDFTENMRVVKVSDNGAGIDGDRLVEKALEKGLITQKEADSMKEPEKFELIFRSGFSTAAEVSDISGRGVGMDIVRKKIEEMNGTIEIDSKLGEGTTFTVTMPV